MDDGAIKWMAGADHGPLRPILTTTTRGATLLVPWITASGVLLAQRTPSTRAAVARGWAAMGLASVIDNGVVKSLVDRDRPDPGRLPRRQRRSSTPSTSAFPSGHIAAAIAFAVAAGRDVPGLQNPLLVTAMIVAYANIYVGRHFLSDAVVGAGIGAASGAMARRLPVPAAG